MNYYSVYSILTSTFSKKTGQKLPAQYDHIHNKNLFPAFTAVRASVAGVNAIAIRRWWQNKFSCSMTAMQHFVFDYES